ncbi:hypothetical protein RF55_10637 [Lasius niger]|uniref:Retrotransposon gag domain-containing protein n=1 Tax=Lasius niger TaxID=67767 RepID=A0A0J7KH00_LASNI|nr:hypothetical protein RF55_10637 [Lasius niger]
MPDVKTELDQSGHVKNIALVSIVPELQGDNCKEYFECIQNTANLAGWTEAQCVAITIIKLVGGAKLFYESEIQGKGTLSFAELKSLFYSHFLEKCSLSEALHDFNSCRQIQGERVRDYATRLRGLSNKALSARGGEELPKDFVTQVMLSQFMSGLDGRMRAQLIVSNPKTYQEAVELAKRVEESLAILVNSDKVAGEETGQVVELNKIYELLEDNTKMNECVLVRLVDRVMDLEDHVHHLFHSGGRDRNRVVDDNVEPGGCLNEDVCGRQWSGLAGNATAGMPPGLTEMPVVPVKVGGQYFRGLIDSGATVNIVSSYVLSQVKDKRSLNHRPIQVRAVTGVIIQMKDIVECEVLLGERAYTVRFFVAQEALSTNFDIILGLEFLTKYRFVIDCEKGALINKEISLNWRKDETEYCGCVQAVGETQARAGETLQTITMRPYSLGLVEVAVPEVMPVGSEVLVEPNRELMFDKCLVARSISSVLEGQVCLVQLLNYTGEEIRLNRRTQVAVMLPVVLEEKMEEVSALEQEERQDGDRNEVEDLDLEHLEGEQKDKLKELLTRYGEIFTKDLVKLGECDVINHRIRLTDDVPVRQKPYRVPYHLKPEMKTQIQTLLRAGILVPSTTPYAAPVLLVKKADGSYRLVADLRKLNAKTIPDNYPLPDMQEMINLLAGAKFFTTLDLTSGFH